MNTALLIIDAQVNMFEPNPIHRAAEIQSSLRELIGRARAAGAPVIFIRNNGGPGEPDEPGTPGWPIHPNLAPMASEVIIDKHTPDSFYQTKLAGELAATGVRRLVLAGLQTEYCIDTTCRRAFSLEYDVVLAADAHSTYDGILPADQIIAHHNKILAGFASVLPAGDISFQMAPVISLQIEALTAGDLAGIAAGLEEWQAYDRWLATGKGTPFWPYTHPGQVADTLKRMWKPEHKPHPRYLDPPRWEMGVARTFLQPLENIPMVFRRAALTQVAQAIDHLLQNPRNPLSPHISQVNEQVWMYDARDLRLIYVPHTTIDPAGQEHRYIFLMWLAPGVPVHNPFA